MLKLEKDIIYLAGLIDGEGSIFIKKAKGRKNPIHSLELEISMTHKPTIESIYKMYGFGSFRASKRKKKMSHHKQAWRICFSSNDAVKVINDVLPYLRTKRGEAELALEFAKLKEKHCGRRGLSEEMMQLREDYYNDLKNLKLVEWVI